MHCKIQSRKRDSITIKTVREFITLDIVPRQALPQGWAFLAHVERVKIKTHQVFYFRDCRGGLAVVVLVLAYWCWCLIAMTFAFVGFKLTAPNHLAEVLSLAC